MSSGARPPVPDADSVPGGGFNGFDDYVALMRRCYAQNPGERPGFEEVVHELRRLWEGVQQGGGAGGMAPASGA